MITIGDAVLFLSANQKQYDSDLKDAERKANNWVSTVGDIFKNGMGTAFGFFIHDLVGGAIRGLQNIAGEALNSYSSYERLGLSLESLVARELMRGQVTQQTSQVVQSLTDAERGKLEELIAHQKIADAGVLDLQAKFDAEHAKVIANGGEWSAKLTELEGKITLAKQKAGEYAQQIADLQGKEGQLVTITKDVISGQLSHAEAMAQAGPKAKELLEWITKLAVLSPFKQSEVADAFRMAMAYGFTADESKRLTEAMINFAAGSGASADTMSRIALALGQIKAKGKLAGQEVLQLVNAGLPVTDILARAFNKTTAEIEEMRTNGLIKADDAIQAIVKSLETDFAGAAERQATSWAGLLSTFDDIKNLGLRELFTGIFKAIQPYAQQFVGLFTDGDLLPRLNEIGNVLGEKIGGALAWIAGLFDLVKERFNGFTGLLAAGYDPIDAAAVVLKSLVPPELRGFIDDVAGALKDLRDRAGEAWEKLKPIRDALQDVFDAIKNNDPKALGEAVGRLFGEIGTALGPALEPIRTLLATWIGDAFKDVTKKANEWGGEMWAGFQEGFKKSLDLSWLGKAIAQPFEDAKQWLMTNSPELFAGILTALVVLQAMWNAAMLVLGPSWDAFVQSVSNAWNQWLKPVFDALLPYGGYVLMFIGGVFLLLVGIVVGALNGIVVALNWAAPFISLILMGIGSVVAGIIEIFMGLGMFIYKLFTGDIPGAFQELGRLWTGLLDIVVGLVGTIVGVIGGAIALILGLVWGLISGIIDFFVHLYEELVGHSIIPDMLKAMIDVFAKKFDEIKESVKKFIDGIIKVFTDFRQKFVDVGGWLMDDVLKGILQKTAQIIGAVTGMVKDAIAAAGTALGLASPTGGSTGGKNGDIKSSAGGNRLKAGQASIVGELGRELIVPAVDSFVLPSVPDLTKAASGLMGAQHLTIEVPLVLDEREVGRATVDGTLDELAARGLKVVPA